MDILSNCPACGCDEWDELELSTRTTAEHEQQFGAYLIREASYVHCRRCELVFARERQDADEIEDYYCALAIVEKRTYTTYPPPKKFIEAQQGFSQRLLGVVNAQGLIRSDMSVLNLRCEIGVHLARLRDEFGVGQVYGLDHFETNIEYARRDFGLANVDYLHPFRFEIPFQPSKYDMILANHQLTHALDPVELLRNLRSLVAPSGVVVFYTEPDHVPILRRPKSHRVGVNSYHKQLLCRNSLRNLCSIAGFDAELVDYNPKHVPWAANKHSMIFVARPCEPVSAADLPPSGRSAIYEAYTQGQQRSQSGAVLHTLRTMFGLQKSSGMQD